MSKIIIDATHTGELRVAVTDKNNKLVDLEIERESQLQKKSNIYKGVISSIEPSLGAVFVNYGAERHGFLPIKDISREYYLAEPRYQDKTPTAETAEQPATEPTEEAPTATDETTEATAATPEETKAEESTKKTGGKKRQKQRHRGQLPLNLNDILKVGQEVVIQVEKEERGNKGAALTTYISLAGAYLVLMPNNANAGGVSRRIEGDDREQVRSALQALNIPENMGLIVRTAGVGKNSEELQWDLNILLQYWEAVKQAAVAEQGPYLIHQESDAVIRAIRDYLRAGVEEIIVNDKECFHRATSYINRIRPSFANNLKYYDDTLPIFSYFQVEKQIEACYLREIRLPSGGSIVIDHTEALVSIDINSARATRGSDIEETALNTNLEAAQEIARQLRIRDIGGLVVIDFIDMTPAKHQREVENKLKEALRMDRARIQVGKISRFGLLEMSRQRVGQSLRLASHITCPRCSGQGTIRSIESLCFSLLHIIQEQAAKNEHVVFTVQLPVDVATYMINEKRQALSQIELAHDAHIIIVPNPHLTSPHYNIKQAKMDKEASGRKQQASYKLMKQPKMQQKLKSLAAANTVRDVPAVHKYMPTESQPAKKQPTGLFKQLWNKVTGVSDTPEPVKEEPAKKEPNTGNKPRQQGSRHHNKGRNNQNKRKPRNNQQRRPNNNQERRNEQTGEQKNRNQPKQNKQPKPEKTEATKPKQGNKPAGNRNNKPANNKQRNSDKKKQYAQPTQVEVGPNATQQEKLAAAQLQNTLNQMQQYTEQNTHGNYLPSNAQPQSQVVESKAEGAATEQASKPSRNNKNQKPRGNRKPRSSGNRQRRGGNRSQANKQSDAKPATDTANPASAPADTKDKPAE